MGGGTSLRHDEHAGTATARDDGGEPQRSGAVRRAAARAGTRRATPLECWFGLLVTAAAFSTASAALVSRWNLGAEGQTCVQVCAAVGGVSMVCDAARRRTRRPRRKLDRRTAPPRRGSTDSPARRWRLKTRPR